VSCNQSKQAVLRLFGVIINGTINAPQGPGLTSGGYSSRPATPKDDGPTPAGVLGHDTVILVVAGHLLGLVGGRDQHGGKLAR
jgi:hypothetical protein